VATIYQRPFCGMCTGLADAETLKKNFGNAVRRSSLRATKSRCPRWETALAHDVATHGGRDSEPRAASFSNCCGKTCATRAFSNHCIAGLVLSGGASRLPGILDVRNRCCEKRAPGLAHVDGRMPSFMAEPEFATCWHGVLRPSRRLARACRSQVSVRDESSVRRKRRVRSRRRSSKRGWFTDN